MVFETDPLKFVVFVDLGWEDDEQKVKSGGFKYLHVLGELDTVKAEDRGYSLYEHTKSSSDILKHPGVTLFRTQIDNVRRIGCKTKWEMDMMDNFGKHEKWGNAFIRFYIDYNSSCSIFFFLYL